MKFLTTVTTLNPEIASNPPPALMAALGQLGMQAGVRMLDTGGMSRTATVTTRKGVLTTDGPFTEAKEMVGGYGIYELDSEEDVMEWTRRFLEVHHLHWPEWEGEVVIQQLHSMGG